MNMNASISYGFNPLCGGATGFRIRCSDWSRVNKTKIACEIPSRLNAPVFFATRFCTVFANRYMNFFFRESDDFVQNECGNETNDDMDGQGQTDRSWSRNC